MKGLPFFIKHAKSGRDLISMKTKLELRPTVRRAMRILGLKFSAKGSASVRK